MEVMNPQLETAEVESFASSGAETPQLAQIAPAKFGLPEVKNSDGLGFQDLNEIDLSDVVHFKRVVHQRTGLTESNAVLTDGRPPPVKVQQSFRLSMDDTVAQILPGALRKYKINAAWQEYSIYIAYDDPERCLDHGEKPLPILKKLEREGREPVFTIRRKQEMIQINRIDDDTVFPEIRNIVSPSIGEDYP